MKPTLIKAIDPADLILQVQESIRYGKDMHTPLFVDDHGMLCQFVVPSLCAYEYQLVIAKDLDDLELHVQNLTEMGYEFIFNTVMWRGKYLQWMSRLNPTGLSVRDAVVKLGAKAASDIYLTPAEREDELRLVEDVREALHMEPTAKGGYVVQVPYPLLGS